MSLQARGILHAIQSLHNNWPVVSVIAGQEEQEEIVHQIEQFTNRRFDEEVDSQVAELMAHLDSLAQAARSFRGRPSPNYRVLESLVMRAVDVELSRAVDGIASLRDEFSER